LRDTIHPLTFSLANVYFDLAIPLLEIYPRKKITNIYAKDTYIRMLTAAVVKTAKNNNLIIH
jgi:hypothetical protein